jgi:uncharacterized protein (TIGR03435 family)
MRNALPISLGPIALGIALSLAAGIQAQTIGAEPKLSFEVASIKPNASLSGNRSINRAPGGALNATNVTFRMLMSLAYDVRDYQILNSPAWTGTEGYDIRGKVEAAEAAADGPERSPESRTRLQRRVQALLAERFGLIFHTETKEMSIYALAVAKGGPKLAETKTEIGPQISANPTHLTCKKVTMKTFAEVALQNRMGRKVIDKTGLSGEYDFTMEFAPDEGAPNAKDGDHAEPSLPGGPSFLTALQEQLGLRLEPAKGPAEFLVIDQVQRPSAN